MAVKSSGAISLGGDVVGEFGGTAPHSLSEYYRGGALVPNVSQNNAVAASGAIALGSFYSTVRGFEFAQTIAANRTDYNLRNEAIAAGWDGSIPLFATITINAGVYILASSTGVYAFDTGSIPAGSTISITNNGAILGRGGNGGNGGSRSPGGAGGGGGPGLIARAAATIANNGWIAGGGGGGGGGGSARTHYVSLGQDIFAGGGGAGGGRGNSSGGVHGDRDTVHTGPVETGTSGGGGTISAPGGGGARWVVYYNHSSGTCYLYGGNGGSGGGVGSSGGAGVNSTITGSPGITQDNAYVGGSGGAGGNAIAGNANITWSPQGTIYGGIT